MCVWIALQGTTGERCDGMSTFRLNNEHLTVTEGQWTLERDEAATIWYALDVYKTKLEQSLAAANSSSVQGVAGYYEELSYVYDHLHKVTNLMFELRDNHETDERGNNAVRRWLDVT